MQVKPRVLCQPFGDVGMFVGTVVVADDVDLLPCGHLAVDDAQEL